MATLCWGEEVDNVDEGAGEMIDEVVPGHCSFRRRGREGKMIVTQGIVLRKEDREAAWN